jgi:hypothetical protein
MSGLLPRTFAAFVLATAFSLMAVTTQSLWIDEANSAVKAMAPDWASFVAVMRSERGSDLQMPLYMAMLWAWEKLFGCSEFALRAMNIPLFATALAAAAGCWRTIGLNRVFFVIFACSSAFMWAYLDEARPYILQFLGATMCVIPMANLAETNKPPQTSDITLFAAGVLLLCGSSLFGVVSAFWFCLAFLMLALQSQCLSILLARKDLRIAIGLTLPLLLLFGMYYWWTLALGAKASSVGKTGLLNVVHTFYELAGMAGLGPGRGDLRASPSAIVPFIPLLTAYACAVGLLIGAGIFTKYRRGALPQDRRPWLVFWLAPIAIALSTLAVGVFGDFRVVGRHLTPLLPFFLILLSIAAAALWQGGLGIAGRTIAILAILATLGSALAYRTGARHTKDDYRSAASLAHDTLAEGGTVWWAADPAGARYYHLDLGVLSATAPRPIVSANRAHLAWNVQESVAAMLPGIDMVILSKPDIYDEQGTLRKLLASHKYTLHAAKQSFRIYTVGSASAGAGTE